MITFGMVRHGSTDLEGVLLTLKEFFSAKTFREFGDCVSCYLPQLFSGQGSMLAPFRNGKLDPERSIRSGLCESGDAIKLYLEHFYQIDPFVVRPFTPYPDKVYTTDDVIKDEESFLKSEYYNDFLKRFSSRNNMLIILENTEQRLAQIVVTRDHKRAPFGSSEKNLARLIGPSLTVALEKILVANDKLQGASMIDLLLERMQTKGVAELDDSFRLIRKNQNWDAMIGAYYREHETRKELPEIVKRELRSQMNKLGSGSEVVLKMESPGSGYRLFLSLRQLVPEIENSGFLLFIGFEYPFLFASKQMKRYRLTEREMEVAALIFEGLENGEIADQLCVSKYTVVNHIRHIFEKASVRSRAELFRRVLELTL